MQSSAALETFMQRAAASYCLLPIRRSVKSLPFASRNDAGMPNADWYLVFDETGLSLSG